MAMNDPRQNNQLSMTTNSLSIFDENGLLFKIGYLDETVSIGMWEPMTDPATGKRSYPKEMRNSLLLTPERVAALLELINTTVINNVEAKTPYNGGVFTSNKKDSIFEILVDKMGEDVDIYLLFHKNINQERVPDKTVAFKFKKVPIIQKYNSKTGEFELYDTHGEFYMFVKVLEGFLLVNANGNAGHSMRNHNKYTTDKIFKYLAEFATKMGVTVGTTFQAPPSGFQNQVITKDNQGDNIPIEEYKSLEDLMM